MLANLLSKLASTRSAPKPMPNMPMPKLGGMTQLGAGPKPMNLKSALRGISIKRKVKGFSNNASSPSQVDNSASEY